MLFYLVFLKIKNKNYFNIFLKKYFCIRVKKTVIFQFYNILLIFDQQRRKLIQNLVEKEKKLSLLFIVLFNYFLYHKN